MTDKRNRTPTVRRPREQTDIGGQIRAALAGKPPTAASLREVRKAKADAVAQAFANHPARNTSGVVSIRTRGADIRIRHMQTRQLADGNTCVEVYLDRAAGEPHWRIVNPPILVEDPRGPVELAEGHDDRGVARTRRYREDPVAAVAEAIAAHGGGSR